RDGCPQFQFRHVFLRHIGPSINDVRFVSYISEVRHYKPSICGSLNTTGLYEIWTTVSRFGTLHHLCSNSEARWYCARTLQNSTSWKSNLQKQLKQKRSTSRLSKSRCHVALSN